MLDGARWRWWRRQWWRQLQATANIIWLPKMQIVEAINSCWCCHNTAQQKRCNTQLIRSCSWWQHVRLAKTGSHWKSDGLESNWMGKQYIIINYIINYCIRDKGKLLIKEIIENRCQGSLQSKINIWNSEANWTTSFRHSRRRVTWLILSSKLATHTSLLY